MSTLLRLDDLYFAHPGQADYLISGASWELSQGQKVGLLGYNGAGKSTLLGLLEGGLTPEAGAVERHYQSLFVMRQDDQAEGEVSARDYLLAAAPELLAMHRQMAQMEAEGLPDPLAYADLSQRFLEAGGYERLARLERVAVDFGFRPELPSTPRVTLHDLPPESRRTLAPGLTLPPGPQKNHSANSHRRNLDRPVASFSGGERRLLKLASAFVRSYDLYLLDEPTNYLDNAASERLVRALRGSPETLVLVRALRGSPETLVLVSHDRWFLDQVADHVVELERGKLRVYSGDYSTFAATKAAEYLEAARKKEKLEREIAKLKEVERTYKAWGKDREADKYRPSEGLLDKGYIGAKAAKLQGRAVQAKERVAERIEELEETKPWVEKFYQARFAEVERRTGWALDVQKLSHRWGERGLFEGLSFRLEWGEKVHLAGENGSGKSTLIKLLLGGMTPQAGEVRWGSRTRVGYLPQQGSGLDEKAEVHQLFPREQHLEARTLLGAFKVSGERFFLPLAALSEGQRRKVRLVKLILEKPNFLILDEPTTHLDYQSVEMLEAMLKDFGGTVLFTSHDRYLASRVAGRVISL